jgi:hypothetical protein
MRGVAEPRRARAQRADRADESPAALDSSSTADDSDAHSCDVGVQCEAGIRSASAPRDRPCSGHPLTGTAGRTLNTMRSGAWCSGPDCARRRRSRKPTRLCAEENGTAIRHDAPWSLSKRPSPPRCFGAGAGTARRAGAVGPKVGRRVGTRCAARTPSDTGGGLRAAEGGVGPGAFRRPGDIRA